MRGKMRTYSKEWRRRERELRESIREKKRLHYKACSIVICNLVIHSPTPFSWATSAGEHNHCQAIRVNDISYIKRSSVPICKKLIILRQG